MHISLACGFLWISFCLVGYIVYGVFDRGDGTFYDISPSDVTYTASTLAHFISAIFLVFGAYLTNRSFAFYKKLNPIQVLRENIDSSDDSLLRVMTVFAAAASVLSSLSAYGLDDLLYRSYYLPEVGVATTIAQLTGILSTLLASILACRSNRSAKLLAAVCYICGFLMVFSKGSRYAVISILIYQFLPLFMQRGRSLIYVVINVIVTVSLAYILMHSSLYFRTDFQYGLLPYVNNLGDAISSMSDDNFQSVWDNFLNVTFSLPVTQVTIEAGGHNFSSMLIALNPMPGELAGWYQIADEKRVSDFIPFSAIGELYGFSPFLLMLYMLCVGVVFSIVENELNCSHDRLKLFLTLFVFAFVLLFSLLVLQYNLRNSTRMIYYLSAVLFLNRLLSKFVIFDKKV